MENASELETIGELELEERHYVGDWFEAKGVAHRSKDVILKENIVIIYVDNP